MRYYFLIGFMASCYLQHAQQGILRQEIEKIIFYDTYIPLTEHHGFWVGIVDKDSTYNLPFAGSPEYPPLADGKFFELGGLSKVFTASLVMVLEGKGLINLDEGINEAFAKEYQNPGCFLTWRHLLSHQSGFPKTIAGIGVYEDDQNGLYANFKKSQLRSWYLSFQHQQDLKSSFSYSHINYAILELALESKLDLPYLELLNKYLLLPLNLESSISGEIGNQSLEPGFSKGGLPVHPWEFSSFMASLGLKANLGGLIKWVQILLGTIPCEDQNLFLKCMEPVIDTGLPGRIWMSTGWYSMLPQKRPSIVLHGGSTTGHKAFIGIVPETQTGVVILSRSPVETEDLGLLILRLINHNWKKKNR